MSENQWITIIVLVFVIYKLFPNSWFAIILKSSIKILSMIGAVLIKIVTAKKIWKPIGHFFFAFVKWFIFATEELVNFLCVIVEKFIQLFFKR